jgi:hypothetical protein
VEFFAWEVAVTWYTAIGQLVRLLPDLQFVKIFHGASLDSIGSLFVA